MVGKTAYQLIQVLKQFGEHQDRDLLCKELENILIEELRKVGIEDFQSLTDSGMLATLFYLYGVGLIDADFIVEFAEDPKREDISFYKLQFAPSNDDKRPFILNVKYMREGVVQRMNYETAEPEDKQEPITEEKSVTEGEAS